MGRRWSGPAAVEREDRARGPFAVQHLVVARRDLSHRLPSGGGHCTQSDGHGSPPPRHRPHVRLVPEKGLACEPEVVFADLIGEIT